MGIQLGNLFAFPLGERTGRRHGSVELAQRNFSQSERAFNCRARGGPRPGISAVESLANLKSHRAGKPQLGGHCWERFSRYWTASWTTRSRRAKPCVSACLDQSKGRLSISHLEATTFSQGNWVGAGRDRPGHRVAR